MSNQIIVPSSFFISDVADVPPHKHTSHEILFVLAGQCKTYINDELFLMKKGDILMVNSQIMHSHHTDEQCIHVTIQIEFDKMILSAENRPLLFEVNSVKYPDMSQYNHLRHLLAKLILVQEYDDYNTAAISVLYEIISVLIRFFTYDKKTSSLQSTSKYLIRLSAILEYITEHYAEGLSLTSTAEAFNLSVPYLSSFFKKYTNMTLMEYYNEIRLSKTTQAILDSDESIDSIACKNGFTDVRTFVRLFRKRYGVLPSQYRKAIHAAPFPTAQSRDGNMFHPSLGKSAYQNALSEFLEQELPSPSSAPDTRANTTFISCGTLMSGKEGRYLFEKYCFHKICYLDDIADLMIQNVQDILSLAQKEICFDGIYFPILKQNAFLLGESIRFLNRLTLAPYFVISLTEEVSTDELTGRLQSSLQFLIHDFGMPFLESCHFFIDCDNPEAYFPQYQQTFLTIKTECKNLPVICPPCSLFTDTDCDSSRRFLSRCRNSECLPDMITFRYCERELSKKYNCTENYNQAFHNDIYKFLSDLHILNIPYQLYDIDTLQGFQNPVNDSCFRSCYIIHNLLTNLGQGNYMCLWKLSDFCATAQTNIPLFHGGLGLLTYNGIPKPSYYVLSFFHQLGHEVLKIEDGWIVSRQGNQLIILFYNFQFYHDLIHHPMPAISNAPLDDISKICYTLKIDQIDGDYFRLIQYCINQTHGSTFDFWNQIGSPVSPNNLHIEFMRSINTNDTASYGKINNGIINLEALLDSLEVRLIIIDIIKTSKT